MVFEHSSTWIALGFGRSEYSPVFAGNVWSEYAAISLRLVGLVWEGLFEILGRFAMCGGRCDIALGVILKQKTRTECRELTRI
jgi:hypothetical protein